MKVELEKVVAGLQHFTKAPKLAIAIAALGVVVVAIKAIGQYTTHPVLALTLIAVLAVFALCFAFRGIDKL